jgi:hypothetical protein
MDIGRADGIDVMQAFEFVVFVPPRTSLCIKSVQLFPVDIVFYCAHAENGPGAIGALFRGGDMYMDCVFSEVKKVTYPFISRLSINQHRLELNTILS